MKNVLCILTAVACSAGTGLLAEVVPAPAPAPQENPSPATPAPPPEAAPAPAEDAPATTPAPEEQAKEPQSAPAAAAPAPTAVVSAAVVSAAETSATAPAMTPEQSAASATLPTSADASTQVAEQLKKVIEAHAGEGISAMMREVNKAFPDSASVSVEENTEVVNGEGSRVLSVSIVGKDGTKSTCTIRKPLEKKVLNLTPADVLRKSRVGVAQPPQPDLGAFRDQMAEGILARADHICTLLDGIRDRAAADKTAPRLWEQCVQLEDMLTASRARRLPHRYLGRLIQKYNGEMETRFNKMDHLISALAAKNYYGSATLRRAAEQLCE